MRTLFIYMLFFCSCAYGQSFEGIITYRLEAFNPNPKLISDSVWQVNVKKEFGVKGEIIQTYYYKDENYKSETKSDVKIGYQVYNPKDKLIYSWNKESDTAITVDSRKYVDEFIEIKSTEDKDTILGIPCVSVLVKSKLSKITLWYNSDQLKIDAKHYTGHKYGHWEQITKELKCLPLKIEIKGFMVHMVQTAISFENKPLENKIFELPTFKQVLINPVN